jgi:hypothetical protein
VVDQLMEPPMVALRLLKGPGQGTGRFWPVAAIES